MTLGVIVLAASWFMLLTVLLLDFGGILHRGNAVRWQATGLLVMNGAALVNAFGEFRGWSYGQLDELRSVTFPVTVAGFAIFAVGLFLFFRTRSKQGRAS